MAKICRYLVFILFHLSHIFAGINCKNSGDGFDEFFTMGMYNLEADTYSEFFNKQIEE